jgi:hypothetical protein
MINRLNFQEVFAFDQSIYISLPSKSINHEFTSETLFYLKSSFTQKQ